MILQQCKSHERNNNPQAWEDYATGNENEIVAVYNGLNRISRIDSGWRVIDDNGQPIEMMDFLYQNVK